MESHEKQSSSAAMALELCHLQSHFQVAIRKLHSEPTIISSISEQGVLTSAERFDIYRASIIGNHIKALRELYCVCDKLVGPDFFTAMAELFVVNTESDSSDLGEYGSEFPNFISHFPPAQSLAYLADVARLEWCWHLAYTGPEIKFAADDIKRATEELGDSVIFYLATNLYLLRSQHPIHRIWEVNQEDASGEEVVDLALGGVCLLIWRPELDVHIQILTQDEWELLTSIAKGLNLGTICQELAHLDIALILPQWFQKGWLTH